MQKKKVKIGVLLNSFYVSPWEYRMIEIIHQCGYAEIKLAIINDTLPNINQEKKIISKIRNNYGSITSIVTRKILEYLYLKLIERKSHCSESETKRSLETLLTGVQVIRVKPIQKKYSDIFCERDIIKINEHNLDILVRLGFRVLRGDVLTCSKYGIWSFHHGDNFINRGGPPGFWESMESWPETGSILQILTEDLDNGKVLYRSYSATNTMSVSANRKNYYWKTLWFLPRKIQELYNMGEEEFFKKVECENRDPYFYANRLYKTPNNFEYGKLLLRKIIEKIKLLYVEKHYFDQWILMYDLKETFSSSLWRYKKIIPPRDRFWADPHIIYKNDKYYIFIEEYLYETHKGHISLIVMEKNGDFHEPIKVLEMPYHLSYPSVFEYNNEYYMIPETYENHSVELYRCIDFPNKWKLEMTLLSNINAVDTTIIFHEGKWWLFANMWEKNGASPHDELFLFYSDRLFNNNGWKPHPMNPIISDVKTSRPAGKIFKKDGRLYRPSQNCSVRYGYGFNISRIDVLDEYNYKEQVVSRVMPNWDKNIIATHTFNRCNTLHIIDAQIRRRK